MADADASIVLRPATAADARRVFEWRNIPFLVERSSSQRTVTWTEHESWWAHATGSPDSLIFIVERSGEPIGQVRFDRRSSTEGVISVYLLQDYTGRGFGVAAIREGCRRVRASWNLGRVIACVRSENTAGHAGFLKGGFRRVSMPGACPDGHVCYVLDQW